MAEHGNGQPAKNWNHYAEIVHPEMLGQWAMDKNPSLQYLHEAMQDWGERRGDPSRRPVCMTCPHEFQVNARMPSAWMFVRLSVNKAGVPKQMILVGICEKCAVKDDVTGGFCRTPQGVPRHARVQSARGSAMVGRRELKWVAGEEAGSIYLHSHCLSQPVPPDALTAILSAMEPKA